MIAGTGIDLVNIERVRRAYERRPERFMQRIFTEGERAYIRTRRGSPYSSMAVRFAAKEAALKALGCGIGRARLNDIEVVSESGKPPRLKLHGRAARIAREMGVGEIKISLSHETGMACAMAVAMRRPARRR